MKKLFTRQERVVYYAKSIADLESRLAYCNKRLAYLTSDDYKEQDFRETVTGQIEKARKALVGSEEAG